MKNHNDNSMMLLYSSLIMFIGSFIIQYFIMSRIMVYRFGDIKYSLGKLYMSLIMAFMMVFIEVLMHDIFSKKISIKYYIINLILISIVIYLYKNQINIDEKEYLKEMIEHHSMALLTSSEIKDKTKNEKVKELANNIINTQKKEIDYMNKILSSRN